MTRALFLSHLREGLAGLPDGERAEIMADYEAHFSEGLAKGRSETDIEASLGDPARLSKELNAEASLKSWEEKRSPRNFLRAGLALLGLATLDLFLLLPIFIFLVVSGALLFAFTIVGIVGVGVAISGLFKAALSRIFAGFGLVALGTGIVALVLMLLGAGLKLFGRYGRLHYRLLDKTTEP